MMVTLEDQNTTHGTLVHKRFFFTPAGQYLVHSAVRKPYYIYEGFTKRGKKKWKRTYQVDMVEGQEVVLYAVRGKWRGWQVMACQNGRLETVEKHEGVPPWMVEWAKQRALDKQTESVVE